MFELSVVVPVYNGEEYLEVFLNSLASQEVKNMEVIIVNDGSTDNTLNIIKDYCEEYPYWRYVDNKINKGLNASRNVGLKEATGKYIMFCDADDYIPDNVFNKMLDGEEADMIIGQFRKFSDDAPPFDDYNYDDTHNFYVWEDNINKFIFQDINSDRIISLHDYPRIICSLSPCSYMVKKSLLSEYFDETPGFKNSEGGIFSVPLLFNADKIKVLNEPIYYWRYNLSSLSSNEGLSKDRLMYIFNELSLINDYDEHIADEYFKMILEVILPAFLGDKYAQNRYY